MERRASHTSLPAATMTELQRALKQCDGMNATLPRIKPAERQVPHRGTDCGKHLLLVDAKRGKFLVFDNDATVGRSLIELGEFMETQAELFDLLVTKDSVVVEVGANIGAHTVAIAQRAKWVYAFEPQRRIFNVLCANMALNGLDNVDCQHAAVGDRNEVIDIPTCDFNVQSTNYGAFSLDTEWESSDRVQMMKLEIPCDLLKIDVEGYEAQVLRGAAGMIREHKPIIYVENDRPAKGIALVSLLNELGYAAHWHITPMMRAGNFRGVVVDHEMAERDWFYAVHSQDMLCLPEGMELEMAA